MALRHHYTLWEKMEKTYLKHNLIFLCMKQNPVFATVLLIIVFRRYLYFKIVNVLSSLTLF